MSSELYIQKIVTARKEHHCECCGKKIAPGKKYSFEKWLDDNTGRFEKSELCIPCYCAMQCFFGDYGDPGEWSYQEVHDYLHDEYCLHCQKRADDDCEINEDVFNCPVIQKRICDIEGIEYEQRYD